MPEFREAKSPAPRAASAPSKRCHAGISRSEISGTQGCRHTAGQVVTLGPGSRADARGRDDSNPLHSSMMATARVQPAEAALILTGKHATMKPEGGNASRLCSFSMWQ